jgi:hypothetical protein
MEFLLSFLGELQEILQKKQEIVLKITRNSAENYRKNIFF